MVKLKNKKAKTKDAKQDTLTQMTVRGTRDRKQTDKGMENLKKLVGNTLKAQGKVSARARLR